MARLRRTGVTAVVAVVAGALLAAGGALSPASETAQTVAYPEGYRGFTHVKSMVIQSGHPLFEGFGGIHHVYANPAALSALKSGASFPDGAVLVFDLLDAPVDGGAVSEGARKVVAVMHKDSKRFASTGGWGFEGFKADTRERLVSNPTTQCFACHEPRKAQDYTFSRWRP